MDGTTRLLLVTGAGAVALVVYGCLLASGGSRRPPAPSPVVVAALVILALLSALLRWSQIADGPMTAARYLELAAWALAAPALCAGLVVVWLAGAAVFGGILALLERGLRRGRDGDDGS